MKRTFLLLVSIISTLGIYAANDVIKFTWKGSNERQKFYITATEGEPFTVDWGDGNGAQSYTIYYSDEIMEQPTAYGNENEYTVTITADGDCFITSFSIAGTWSDWENGGGATSVDLSNAQSLLYFFCQYNQLKEVDVAHLTNLKRFDFHYNQLTEVDVTSLSELTYLSCQHNLLTELDLTSNTQLISLSCHSNQLTNLNLTNNTQLVYLYCQSNQLEELDVANNTQLTDLYCQYNQLTELDLTNNALIEYLDCSGNQLYLSCLYAIVKDRESTSNIFLTPQSLLMQAASLDQPFSLEGEMNLGGIQTIFFIYKEGQPTTENVEYSLDYENETITFLQEGDFHVTLNNDAVPSNEWSIAEVNIPFNVTKGSSVNNANDSAITIYPNPATDSFRINGITTPVAFTLNDMTGKTVLKGAVAEGEYIAVDHLPGGIYILHTGDVVSKVIIKD